MNRADLQFTERFKQQYTNAQATRGHNTILITNMLDIGILSKTIHYEKHCRKKDYDLSNMKGIFPKFNFMTILKDRVLFHSKKLFLNKFSLTAVKHFQQPWASR